MLRSASAAPFRPRLRGSSGGSSCPRCHRPVAAGVHIDGDERFRFIDHDIAAARQPHLAVEGIIDLLLHAVALEDGGGVLVMADAARRPPGNLPDDIGHPLDRLLVVANHLVDFIGQEVAHRALDEIGLGKDAGRGGLFLHRLFDGPPLLDEQAEVAHEIARPLAFTNGPHDHTHVFRDVELLQNLAQPVALLGAFDLARNTALVAVGHEHEIAAREAEIGGDARALGADRALGHLDEHFAAHVIDLRRPRR